MSDSIVSALLAAVGENRAAEPDREPAADRPAVLGPDNTSTGGSRLTAHPEYAYTRWQRVEEEAVIDNARKTLADAQATELSGMESIDIAERAIRLEVALRNVLDVIDRNSPS